MEKYFCKLPDYFYSFQVYDVKTLQEAKKEIRRMCGGRLPNGTEFWSE